MVQTLKHWTFDQAVFGSTQLWNVPLNHCNKQTVCVCSICLEEFVCCRGDFTLRTLFEKQSTWIVDGLCNLLAP